MPAKTAASTIKKATGTKKTKKTKSTAAKVGRPPKHKELLFSLDIGTRSVIGIVAEKKDEQLKILATHRQEHTTRAMLDGQIHDVPQVAAVLESVKKSLEKQTGVLKHVAVAAAGRALYTMTAEVQQEISDVITPQQERELEFAGVQAAQQKLAVSNTIDDPTLYYCVGYSTVKYMLDGTQLKTLVGQRGKLASATVIATFLPRQVIDSMQSALHAAKLDMRALTLEPIAAINVLIPPTMRHLNLVLVDIGAGTSDVAVTKDGSVIAYGMVPLAGDEITEAISQKYLLDFNIAEQVKRDVADRISEKISFQDILGITYDLTPEEIIEAILPSIANLAEAIAKQILDLNGGAAPQAVLLVGGGSLTPRLPEFVAQALSLPEPRVAVRRPESIDGIELIPEELQTPDAVTPLGILKIASLNTLHFLSVHVNEQEYSLFNFRDLTIADALLTAGINLKKLNGKPGLGMMVSINGDKKFIPGSMGTAAQLLLDGEPSALDTSIKNGSKITVEPGSDGIKPQARLQDFISLPSPLTVYINGESFALAPKVLVNGEPAQISHELVDGDEITVREMKNAGEIIREAGYDPAGRKFKYKINGKDGHFVTNPQIRCNGEVITLSTPVADQDDLDFIEAKPPKLSDVLNLSEMATHMMIYFNKSECLIPLKGCELTVNGHPATADTIVRDGSDICCNSTPQKPAIISDVLLAAEFQAPAATSCVSFSILLNGQPAEFITPVKNGDSIDVVLTPTGK
ncbi:MAG: cell division protein FtsA [Selenomonadaceae bacterium]